MNISEYFQTLRNNEFFHLDLGDIRLPLAMQNDIETYILNLEHRLSQAERLITELAEELEDEVTPHYFDYVDGEKVLRHSIYKSKYERDMQTVYEARKFLKGE
jgi:hypothetical protein